MGVLMNRLAPAAFKRPAVLLLFVVSAVYLWVFTPLAATAKEGVTLTVHSGERATYRGFGVNQPEQWNRIDAIPLDERKQLIKMMADAKVKVLRIWANGIDSSKDLSIAKQYFEEGYIRNGFVKDYLNGAEGLILILSPWHWDHDKNGKSVPDDVEQYADNVAELILWAKQRHGITIEFTGIANEPGDWPHTMVRDGIVFLRRALDKRGLESVAIVAPDYSGAKGKAKECIDTLKADSKAWNATHGISTHSYNEALTKSFSDYVVGNGKEYWQTEASEVPNIPYEDYFMPTVMARFLNDLNHRASYWLYFVGFFAKSDRPQALIYYDRHSGENKIHWTYKTIKQLGEALQQGAVTRYVTTSLKQKGDEPDMTYNYGQKPAINAAAARNPDGSWFLAVVNDTGIPSEHYLVQKGASKWYPAMSYDVVFKVEELASKGDIQFRMSRSGKKNHDPAAEGTVLMSNGKIIINDLAPWDFVTLVSTKSVGVGRLPSQPSGLQLDVSKP